VAGSTPLEAHKSNGHVIIKRANHGLALATLLKKDVEEGVRKFGCAFGLRRGGWRRGSLEMSRPFFMIWKKEPGRWRTLHWDRIGAVGAGRIETRKHGNGGGVHKEGGEGVS